MVQGCSAGRWNAKLGIALDSIRRSRNLGGMQQGACVDLKENEDSSVSFSVRAMTRLVAPLFRFPAVILWVALSGCSHLVTISYAPGTVIRPAFDQPVTNWEGERVQVVLTPSLEGEPIKYVAGSEKIFLANALRQRGLHHEFKIKGQGTPLVVYSKNPESTPKEKHYPPTGIVLGLTAVKEERPGQLPLLKLYDAFDPSVVRSIYGTHPIAANYTATLAVLYAYSHKVAGSAAGSFLRADNPRFATGIYLTHPYDPNKIPILFVHGLISSPISWQNLQNDLCADPAILEHYQPWFFLYPTGEPILESAEQLREDLRATQRLFDPAGTAVASHHVVVVAHSMGGLLAHTLVSDSGDAVWSGVANKPFNDLTLSASVRQAIEGYFFFRHQPGIDRVIFLAVPHRGSLLAAGLVGSVGNRIIRHPKSVAEALKELAADNPGVLNRYFAGVNARGGPTSLLSLAPNPLLDHLAGLQIQVPFHSIMGDRGLGGGAGSSDGVVSYASSHLDGAESEKIVPAGHTVFSNELTVLEIKRILDKNLAWKRGKGDDQAPVKIRHALVR
jgi:pimeloyl-ACP methyl ester carboxylesterase